MTIQSSDWVGSGLSDALGQDFLSTAMRAIRDAGDIPERFRFHHCRTTIRPGKNWLNSAHSPLDSLRDS